MGFLNGFMAFLFGGGRNVITETAEVFRENSENAGVRSAAIQSEVLRQFAAEFVVGQKTWFDRLIDGMNRLPRPLMAFGTLSLFLAAMYDPAWFSARMQGLSLVPEPLWWLMGAIVSFYFGARHQAKGQEFQASITRTLARTEEVRNNINALERKGDMPVADVSGYDEPVAGNSRPRFETGNAALRDWQAANG